jgi:hypothetical protein
MGNFPLSHLAQLRHPASTTTPLTESPAPGGSTPLSAERQVGEPPRARATRLRLGQPRPFCAVSKSGVLLAVAGCGVLQHRLLGQTVGAPVAVVNDPHAATIVLLVQTASTLPIMLLALPAGVLADAFDRR